MHGLVRCIRWVQVFARARGGCDNHRYHNINPREEMWPGTWMTLCPKAMGWGFWNLKKTVSWDSTLEEGSWFSGVRWGETSSLRRDGEVSIVRNCLSLFMSKNLKLKKVIKKFRTWTNFVFFGFLYAYEHYERFMHVNILVVFLDVGMLYIYIYICIL